MGCVNLPAAVAKGEESRDQDTPTAPPTFEQLASIESEGFSPQSFLSHRTADKRQVCAGGSVYSHGEALRVVQIYIPIEV